MLGVRLGVSPVGMVELFVHGASLTTKPLRDGPLFFWRGGDEKSLSTNIFFLSVHLCKQFFSNNTFLQTIFFDLFKR